MWRTDWVRKKQQIAEQLASGQCGGSYGEAVLILCSALSALAAEVWPGDRIDRKRFVELLKDHAPPLLAATRVSIPLLLKHLRRAGRAETSEIESAFLNFPSGQILIGDQVDKTESEIHLVAACSSIGSSEMRECSYANLLYREVRSAYVHGYRPGTGSESWTLTDSAAPVSYVNRIDDPDRRIHFSINWISKLAIGAAQAVDQVAAMLPLPQPARWWLDG